MKTISGWVDQCIHSHQGCQQAVEEHVGVVLRRLPARVLDLRPSKSISANSPQLTDEFCGPYVALSHCWGNNCHLITERTTLSVTKRAYPSNTYQRPCKMRSFSPRTSGCAIFGLILCASYKMTLATGGTNRRKWLMCTEMLIAQLLQLVRKTIKKVFLLNAQSRMFVSYDMMQPMPILPPPTPRKTWLQWWSYISPHSRIVHGHCRSGYYHKELYISPPPE